MKNLVFQVKSLLIIILIPTKISLELIKMSTSIDAQKLKLSLK